MKKYSAFLLFFAVATLGPACTSAGTGGHHTSLSVVHAGAKVTVVHFGAPW